MTIQLNGETKALDLPDKEIPLSELLIHLDYRQQHFAVALNEVFVPRTKHESTLVADGDAVEVVAPMQGG